MTEHADHLTQLRQSAMIARVVGVVTIALGFVTGLQGLDEPGSGWLPTAQGLIVTGLCAQGYALWCTIRWKRERAEQEGRGSREERR